MFFVYVNSRIVGDNSWIASFIPKFKSKKKTTHKLSFILKFKSEIKFNLKIKTKKINSRINSAQVLNCRQNKTMSIFFYMISYFFYYMKKWYFISYIEELPLKVTVLRYTHGTGVWGFRKESLSFWNKKWKRSKGNTE